MTTEPIKINKVMLAYMQRLTKTEGKNNDATSELFSKEILPKANACIHTDNYYITDQYGLLIRKACQNEKKSPFGWVFYENKPINIHINEILIKTNDPHIRELTIQNIKKQFPKLFEPPRGTVYKLYKTVYPDMDVNNI